MRPLVALLALLATAPLAAAGSPDAPEVTDPAGDSGPSGAAIPAGFEDVDIVAAWFENENADTIDLVIRTAGASRARPNADWFQSFDSGGTGYSAGYIDFPGPFGYVGPYVCVTNDAPASCIGIGGGVSGDLVRATIPRANISSPKAGDTLAITGGAASVIVGVQWVPLDTTAAGLPYVLTSGAVPVDNGTSPLSSIVGATANDTLAKTSGGAANEVSETPAWAAGAAVAATASAMALRRRR